MDVEYELCHRWKINNNCIFKIRYVSDLELFH